MDTEEELRQRARQVYEVVDTLNTLVNEARECGLCVDLAVMPRTDNWGNNTSYVHAISYRKITYGR